MKPRFMRALAALTTVFVLPLISVAASTAVQAAGVEYLMVPSNAMGRDIPVAFSGSGPHAVYLLDAFDASDTVSNWVTAGNAMTTLGGKGIAVVAPAGGAYSMYTDWERDGGRQWETFLSAELPDWLAANKNLAPNGHAVVGVSQGGTAALTLAAFHPERFRYAGSMSGFLYPSSTAVNGAITEGMMRYGGVDTQAMWGPAQLGRWKWHDPTVHVALLAGNDTRLWIYSPQALSTPAPAAMIGYPEQAQGTNRTFFQHYREVGGNNGHFDFPVGGEHSWSSWRPQLGLMAADLAAAIR